MRNLIILTIVLISQTINAQKYFTRTGKTDFKASVDAFEPVEASNNSTTAILKINTGDFAAQLFINAFNFKVALMQEHFNENYMDSDTYPKAIFRGKIEKFSLDKLSTKKEFLLNGTIEIRGIKKEINTLVTAIYKEHKILIKGNFSITPKDFEIKIPSVVRKKIAQQINIIINYELVEKK
ncbi:YceI family protein [uncultured Tenacibaculum sp.]|uniref:YceI family protein n=1 Tax=uncultured Tenacibaculum sp. TaxID=174713 RepID=UPI0026163435|nr:YceI family protein [uncultured Tenacibaculum sp.]